MKRRIYLSLCISGIIVAVLTSMLVLWAVYGSFRKEAMAFLENQSMIVADSMDSSGETQKAYLDKLKGDLNNVRLTLIEDDGTVIYDSFVNAGSMENHANRKEVTEALQEGKGSAIRYSTTLGYDTYYYAVLLEDGAVLRLSQDSHSILAVFYNLLPIIGGIIIIILALCLWIASLLVKKLLKPIYQLSENIDKGEYTGMSNTYDELVPFFNKIKEQNMEIQKQVNRLQKERDTINVVTGNMKEGLVILDKGLNILSVNESAIAFLGAKTDDYTGKSLLALSRNLEIVEAVNQAFDGRETDLELLLSNRYCRVFIYGVTREAVVEGAMILILDITEQAKAEQIRREFSANVSHELKTPLTSITGFAEMITNGMAKNESDVKAFAARIQKETGRLITLIDDIINLSLIEEGKQVERENVHLKAVCTEVMESLEVPAKVKEVSFTCNCEDLTIAGNAAMLRELIFNLCDNAVKYNKQGGSVQVDIVKKGATAVIKVADTGIGIPETYQKRVFERFYRVDKSRSKATGGTGLGLSIVKHVVEYHKGFVKLQSEEGTGTAITVTLPIK